MLPCTKSTVRQTDSLAAQNLSFNSREREKTSSLFSRHTTLYNPDTVRYCSDNERDEDIYTRTLVTVISAEEGREGIERDLAEIERDGAECKVSPTLEVSRS